MEIVKNKESQSGIPFPRKPEVLGKSERITWLDDRRREDIPVEIKEVKTLKHDSFHCSFPSTLIAGQSSPNK